MNRSAVSTIGNIDRVGKISILKNVVAAGIDTEFDSTDYVINAALLLNP